DWHPFAARASTLAAAERPFWLCPGTSSWLSILGRVTNAMGNCAAAVDAARSHGGSGLLVTDWGDMGHLQYPPVSEPALPFAALDRARPRRADGALVLDELRNAAALVSLLCRDGRARLETDGWLASVPQRRREGFAAELAPLIDTHRNLWLARNRPGGLDDSCAWLEN